MGGRSDRRFDRRVAAALAAATLTVVMGACAGPGPSSGGVRESGAVVSWATRWRGPTSRAHSRCCSGRGEERDVRVAPLDVGPEAHGGIEEGVRARGDDGPPRLEVERRGARGIGTRA